MSRETEECKAIFLSVLGSVDARIRSSDDLEQLLQQSGRNASKKVVEKYWPQNTKSLTFQDFVSICDKEPVTSSRDLMKAFRSMDANGDGYISKDEFLAAMTKKGDKLTQDEVLQVIRKVDRNKDGKLDYKEFCELILSNVEAVKEQAVEKYRATQPEPQPRNRGLTVPNQSRGPNQPNQFNDDDSEDEIIIGSSSSSLRPSSSRAEKGQAVVYERKFGVNPQLKKPRNLDRWNEVIRRGCFFYDEVSSSTDLKSSRSSRRSYDEEETVTLISHSFHLNLDRPSNLFITMDLFQDLKMFDIPLTPDFGFVLVKDSQVLAVSDLGSKDGTVYARADVGSGSYRILPFTSGAKFKQRKTKPTGKEASLLKKDKNGKHQLTTAFRDALTDIFNLSDCDGNGRLSREEFNLYNLRTCGEALTDELWEIVEENCKLVNGELTLDNFLHLNLLEAEEDDGNTENLWITLETMGFNRQLFIDQALPFVFHIYTDECKNLKVQTVEFDQALKENIDLALADYTISRGEKMMITDLPNCPIYAFCNEAMVIFAAQNKEKSSGDSKRKSNPVLVTLDASAATNLLLPMALRGKLEKTISSGKFELLSVGVAEKTSSAVNCVVKVAMKT